jgi:hypothetical protein
LFNIVVAKQVEVPETDIVPTPEFGAKAFDGSSTWELTLIDWEMLGSI